MKKDKLNQKLVDLKKNAEKNYLTSQKLFFSSYSRASPW
jgi:hypothetical protein